MIEPDNVPYSFLFIENTNDNELGVLRVDIKECNISRNFLANIHVQQIDYKSLSSVPCIHTFSCHPLDKQTPACETKQRAVISADVMKFASSLKYMVIFIHLSHLIDTNTEFLNLSGCIKPQVINPDID